MDYLWVNYEPDNFYCTDPAPASPLEEVVNTAPGSKSIRINPLCRFAGIFRPLSCADWEAEECALRRPGGKLWTSGDEARAEIENIFYHMLARMDLLRSLHAFILEEEKILSAIRAGQYGETARNCLSALDGKEQKKLAALLRGQAASKGRRLYFLEALHLLFPMAEASYYVDEERWIFYLACSEEDENAQKKLVLWQELFQDITAKPVKIYWQTPFGSPGGNGARIGRFAIY